MRFSMLYSGEQILSFKSCLVFYAGDSLRKTVILKLSLLFIEILAFSLGSVLGEFVFIIS